MSVLVFVTHDFELGRIWLAGGDDRQSHMGLIFLVFVDLSSLCLIFCRSHSQT